MTENRRLKALFAKCTTAELVVRRYAETKHFLGSFQYAMEKVRQLRSHNASQESPES